MAGTAGKCPATCSWRGLTFSCALKIAEIAKRIEGDLLDIVREARREIERVTSRGSCRVREWAEAVVLQECT